MVSALRLLSNIELYNEYLRMIFLHEAVISKLDNWWFNILPIMNNLRLGKDWLANFACALIANFLIMYWYFNVFKVSNKMQNTVACEHRIGTRSFALPQKNHQEEISESVRDC